MKKRRFWLWSTVLYMLLLLFFSVKPCRQDQSISLIMQIIHNVLHVPAFAGLAFLWGNLLQDYGQRTKSYGIIFLICFSYGGALEMIQGYCPGRIASVFDLGLNSLGIFAAMIFLRKSTISSGYLE